jgi:hypothetical protein
MEDMDKLSTQDLDSRSVYGRRCFDTLGNFGQFGADDAMAAVNLQVQLMLSEITGVLEPIFCYYAENLTTY